MKNPMKKTIPFLTLALTLLLVSGLVLAADTPSKSVVFQPFSSANALQTIRIDLSDWGLVKKDLQDKPLDIKTVHVALGPYGIAAYSRCFDLKPLYRNNGRADVLVADLQLTYKPFSCNACGTGKSAYVLDWYPSISKAPGRSIRITAPIQCRVDYLVRFYPETNLPEKNQLVHHAILQGQWPSLKGSTYAFAFEKPIAPFRSKATLVLPASIRNADELLRQGESLSFFFSTNQKPTPKKPKGSSP